MSDDDGGEQRIHSRHPRKLIFKKSCTVVVELFLRQGERFFSENFRCFFVLGFEADFSFLRP